MSKGRGSRSGRKRETNVIRYPQVSSPVILVRSDPVSDILRQVEDRRMFHPERVRPAASFSKPRHRLQVPWQVKRSRWPLSLPIGVQFVDADKVLVCVRRRIRREVMFALKRAPIGLGRKHSWPWKRRYRRTDYSKVRC